METTLLFLGFSFILLWIFKQRRKNTQVVYPVVGGLFIVAYLLIRFLGT